jgi:hypothetical protein
MDEDTRNHLEAMEARLMSRITGAQEALIERIRGVEATVTALTELARSGNTTMALLVSLMSDVGRRVTDLEKK